MDSAVTYDARSLARNPQTPATSSGLPNRRRGIVCLSCSPSSVPTVGESSVVIAVSITPGWTTFTLSPSGPSSRSPGRRSKQTNATFRRRVRRDTTVPLHPGDARHVDDTSTVSLLDHLDGRGFRAVEDAAEVDVHERLVLVESSSTRGVCGPTIPALFTITSIPPNSSAASTAVTQSS